MYLPFTKPTWLDDISLMRIFPSLLCTIVDITLLMRLLRLIGIKYENDLTRSFLGSRIRLVQVMDLGSVSPSKKALTTLCTSPPTISHQDWKNLPFNLSGPRALVSSSLRTTFFTSSRVGTKAIFSFSVGLTKEGIQYSRVKIWAFNTLNKLIMIKFYCLFHHFLFSLLPFPFWIFNPLFL